MKYKTKPKFIEAIQWKGGFEQMDTGWLATAISNGKIVIEFPFMYIYLKKVEEFVLRKMTI